MFAASPGNILAIDLQRIHPHQHVQFQSARPCPNSRRHSHPVPKNIRPRGCRAGEADARDEGRVRTGVREVARKFIPFEDAVYAVGKNDRL